MAQTDKLTFSTLPYHIIERYFYLLAKIYLNLKKPQIVVVAGSVGKTSTKLTIGQLLSQSFRVSYMDESYNSGIGLPMSVFGLKTPESTTNPISWLKNMLKAKVTFFKKSPQIIVLEYGIDHPGEMDAFLRFAVPDISFLTAVTPEHMEFLKDIDTVAREETKILRAAKRFSYASADFIDQKYVQGFENVRLYGKNSTTNYAIEDITSSGSVVTFRSGKKVLKNVKLPLVAEHLINHTAGAVGLCLELGVPEATLKSSLESLTSTPGRTNLLKGANDSTILDDTVNFSPDAGIAALEILKKVPAKRRIVIFGNMHELGEYNEQGFADVAKRMDKLDMVVLVGDISRKYFKPHMEELGYMLGKNLFEYDTSIEAGEAIRPLLKQDDVVLVKGPFGGQYLEECTKILLKNPKDASKLVRQKDYWPKKKRIIFGENVVF